MDNDDEIKIDIGKYIEILVRQWQWIVFCSLGLGILAAIISLLVNIAAPSYQAVALVASAKTVSAVNFGSEITSTSEAAFAQSANGGAQYFYDRKARLQSFVSLVKNGAIAERVLEELGPEINKGKNEPLTSAALLRMVGSDLISSSDTIRISVTNTDPLLAAEIANAWARAYVQQINELYGGSASGSSTLTTEAQTRQAKIDYEKAQAALDDFIAQNKAGEYSRQAEEVKVIITSLREARSSVGNLQVQDRLSRLSQAYADSRQIGLFLDDALSMRAAVNAGGEPAAISNALALTMLKTQIYAAFQGTNTLQVQNLPETLGSNISTITASGMVADLDALISTLEARLTELGTMIETLSFEIQNGNILAFMDNTARTSIDKKIEENEQKVRDLNSLISTGTSTLDELTRARDLTWQTYSALTIKSAEMSVASQTTGIEVVFASPAIPPDKKIVHSTKNALVVAGAGLLFGVIAAYLYEFWQNYKGRQPEIITMHIFSYVQNPCRENNNYSEEIYEDKGKAGKAFPTKRCLIHEIRVFGLLIMYKTLTMESQKIYPHQHLVSLQDRARIKAHQPACLWFTGLSGSGKSTLANAVEHYLNHELRVHTYLLDGDNIRSGLNRDLDFSQEGRRENIRRVGEMAKLFMDAGLLVLTAFISPLQADRDQARQIIQPGRFIEVYVDCPLEICEQRDPKGLYQKARQGMIPDFTGIDSPYEIPLKPEVVLHSAEAPVEMSVTQIIDHLKKSGII